MEGSDLCDILYCITLKVRKLFRLSITPQSSGSTNMTKKMLGWKQATRRRVASLDWTALQHSASVVQPCLFAYPKETASSQLCTPKVVGIQFKLYRVYNVYLWYVRIKVFTAVTMKNAVFWDIMPCGSCKNRLSEERRFLEEPHGVTSQKTAFFISKVS
jgi:hypothetical protein